MDKDREEAGSSEEASIGPDIINVAEGVIAEDGNYYIVTEGPASDNGEVLVVIMNGEGETLETVSSVDGSGMEILDQDQQELVTSVEQSSVSSTSEGVFYQTGYTGQGTSSETSVGNVTIDGTKVEGQYVLTGSKTADQYVIAGALPQQKYIEQSIIHSGGSQIVGGNVPEMFESGTKLKTILPPNLVERLANKGIPDSTVSKKETQTLGTSENLNLKSSKQTTLGYTTISKSIGSQTPVARVTKNIVTIDSLKSLGNVLKSGGVSKMTQADGRNSQSVAMQLGKSPDGRMSDKGQGLFDKNEALDREEMSKTADVLVELATSYPAHVDLMSKDKSVIGITEEVNSNVSESQESNIGNESLSSRLTSKIGEGPKEDKVYKDVSREEELAIILQEIKNMCSKLSDYDEEFIVISINKTLRSSCFSSKFGKEFLDNNPDIVERFLQFSFGKEESRDMDRAKTSSPIGKSMKPVLNLTPVRKSTRKRAGNPKFDSEEFITDSVKSKRNRNFYDSDEDEHIENTCGEMPRKSSEIQKLTGNSNSELKLKHQFPCDVCNKRFRYKDVLDAHMKVHAKVEIPEETEKHDIEQSLESDLNPNRHEQQHRFPCGVCSKRFRRKDVLEVHMKVHADVEVQESGESSADIRTKDDGPVTGDDSTHIENNVDPIREGGCHDNLTEGRVLRKRKRGRPWIFGEDDEDDIMSATTFNMKLRRSWKNIKNEEKVKFKCSVCGMCFRGLYQLKKHYDDHSNCPHCNKLFVNEDKLEMHIARFHKESLKAKMKETASDNNIECSTQEEVSKIYVEDFLTKKNESDNNTELNKEVGKDISGDFEDKIDDNELSIQKGEDGLPRKQEVDGSPKEQDGDMLAGQQQETGSQCQQTVGNDESQTVTNINSDKDGNNLENQEIVEDEFKDHEEENVDDYNENEITLHLEDIQRKKFPCRKCNMEFTTSQNLRRHYKKHINNYEFQCRVCNKQFNRSDLYKSHMIINHGFTGREKTQPYYPFVCTYCGNRYTSRSVLNTHIRSKHSDNQAVFHCDICTKTFKQKAHLNRHMILHNVNRKIFKCDTCGRKFKQKKSLECHKCEIDGVLQKAPKEEGKFVCSTCSKSFVDVRRLNIHFRVHLDGRDRKAYNDLFCNVCKKEFTNVSNLMKHLRFVHSDVRNYICEICQKSFKTKDALVRHSEVHKEIDGSFPCEVCNKFLKSKESLKVHLTTHSEIKPFICEICGASFHQKANLQKHLMIHSDTYNHACDICGRKFRAVETYKAHMRAHAIRDGQEVDVKKFGKYYECEYCQKRIATSSRYKIHLRIHTNEKPFVCEFCEQSFHDPQKYKRHMKKHEIPTEKSAEETLQEIYVQHVQDEGDVTQVINLQDLPFLQNSGVQEVTVQTDETNEAPTLTIYIDQDEKKNNIDDKNKYGKDTIATGTSISKSINPRTPEKNGMESEHVESGNMEDKNTQNNEIYEESISDGESKTFSGQENSVLSVTPKQTKTLEKNIKENLTKSRKLDLSKAALQRNENKEKIRDILNEGFDDQTSKRRSRRFEKNKLTESQTKSLMLPSRTRNASTVKSMSSMAIGNDDNNKAAPKTTKMTCATMTDLEDSENDDNDTDHCDGNPQTRDKTSRTNEELNEKNGFKCCKCNTYFTMKSNLKRHLKSHEKDKSFQCEECGRKFTRIDTMKDHVKQVHMNYKRTGSDKHGRLMPKLFVQMKERKNCDTDLEDRDESEVEKLETLSDSENLTDIRSNDGSLSDDMSERGDKSDSKSNINHQSEVRSDSQNENFTDNDSEVKSEDHISSLSDKMAINNENFEVRRSSRKIKSKDKDLEMYIKDFFRCDVCGRNFFNFFGLKRHLETHASTKNFSCSECDESFASEDVMTAHIKSTHKKRKMCSSSLEDKSSTGKGKKMKINKNDEKENTQDNKHSRKDDRINIEIVDQKAVENNVTYMMDQDLTVERKRIEIENGLEDEDSEKLANTFCEKCGQHCDNIEEHVNIHHISDMYSCEVCENVFPNLNQYRVHVLTEHCSTIISEKEPSETSPNVVKNVEEIVSCNKQESVNDVACQESGLSSDDLSSILSPSNIEGESVSEKNGSFSCEICDVTFSSKNLIDKHLKLKHNQGDYKLPVLVCETCGSEFHERYTLNHHRLTHVKNPKLFDCGICLGNFKSKSSLYNHNCSADGIVSKAKKPFPCKKCRLSFVNSCSLHDHYRKHFMKKTNKFCCKVCCKTFTCYVYLKRHVMYSHAQSRDFVCDICGKDFKRIDTLADHKRSHLPKDGTHKCHLCNKVFKHKVAVQKHCRNVHRDEKKGTAMDDTSEYDYIFSATEYHMDDDLSVERKCYYDALWETTEESINKDYDDDVSQYIPCKFCWKKFADEENLAEHMNEFGLNYVFCEECEKPFTDFDPYKRHMLKVHYPQFSDTDQDNSVKCELCDVAYKNLFIYEKHFNRQHNGDKNLGTLWICETCGQEFNHRNRFNHHRLSHPQNATDFTCGICQSNFQSQISLITHHCGFDTSGYPVGMNLSCRLCSISFSTSDKLHFHLRGHFMKKTDSFFCKICSKQFKMYQYLRRHVMYTHKPSKDLICEQCGKTFKRIDYLKDHLKIHTPMEEIECDICHKFFKHERALQKHKTAHAYKGLTCETCGKQFRFSSSLKNHQLTHTGRPKNFECDQCNKKFAKRTSLENHLITHTTVRLKNPVDGIKQFACPECGKAFKRKDYLVEHTKYVHQPLDGTHKCEICNKIFKHSVAVKKHMAVHRDDKPHMCDICGQSFKQAGNMRKHRQTHSNERQFKCEECGKRFKLKEDMKKHAKRHLINSNDFAAAEKLGKVYCCEICGKKFASNVARVVHIRTHTNERPFHCKFCDKAFKDMGHLRRHEQLHTKSSSKTVKTYVSMGPQVNIHTDQNQIQDIVEASDVSYYVNEGSQQFDQVEHVIVQDIPLPEKVEEVQTIKVITPNSGHGKETIIFIPSSL